MEWQKNHGLGYFTQVDLREHQLEIMIFTFYDPTCNASGIICCGKMMSYAANASEMIFWRAISSDEGQI